MPLDKVNKPMCFIIINYYTKKDGVSENFGDNYSFKTLCNWSRVNYCFLPRYDISFAVIHSKILCNFYKQIKVIKDGRPALQ